MKVHFISIAGSAMHNLALALHEKGYQVTGSDDEFAEPSKSRLAAKGLLPSATGWFVENINASIDAIILGMHARADNPELLKAKELGLPIFSYPEYLYEQSKEKTRLVVGGSHGKTSVTAMILHVLNKLQKDVDYMVGAQLKGFDTMVKISEHAKLMVLEGDEYLSSPIDRRPKFHLYKGNVAILTGIAWDHINVFPTFENYLEQFKLFIDSLAPNATLIYCELDPVLKKLVEEHPRTDINPIPYQVHPYRKNGIKTLLSAGDQEYPIQIFGEHNLQNISAALEACQAVGISKEDFYKSIQDFKGASRRLELIAETENFLAYKDFAHSPSKLKATSRAVKEQFPDMQCFACMELHTFSSLNKEFLQQYQGSMDQPDQAIVYFNPHTIEHKKLTAIGINEVKEAFGRPDLMVFTESALLQEYLKAQNWQNKVIVFMSSGNFDGIELESFAMALKP